MPKVPNIEELGGPVYDQMWSEGRPRKKILICSAPRTGSNNLARLMFAGELGLPLEYFHDVSTKFLFDRFFGCEFKFTPDEYMKLLLELYKKRTFSGLFSTKMQYWQFVKLSKAGVIEDLFDNAFFVYLFRPDIVGQAVSHSTALKSKMWYDKGQVTGDVTSNVEISEYYSSLDFLIREDMGFRKMFGILGITPLFITTDEFEMDPVSSILRIGEYTETTVNTRSAERMVSAIGKYTLMQGAKNELRDQVVNDVGRFQELKQRCIK